MSTPRFPQVAPQLTANGFKPVPITPGTKAPTRLPQWQRYAYTPADDVRFADCGTGIRTGDVLGVDIDVPDVAVVKELLTWLLRTYGMAPVRFGNKPKTLALYRAARPGAQRKMQTAVYKRGELKGKVEVLAKGQQFVAHAIHPDTKQPYEWRGGDPLSIPAADLPTLTAEQVAEIVEHCAARLAQWGTVSAPAPLVPLPLDAAVFPPRGVIAADNDALITQRRAPTRAELLGALTDLAKYDLSDWDSWVRVGAAIHHEMAGSDDGLEMFIAYSRCLSGFYMGTAPGEQGCEVRWRSFGKSGHKPITFGSLIHKLTTLRATGGPQKRGDSKGQEPNMAEQVRVTAYTSALACAGIKAASDKIDQ